MDNERKLSELRWALAERIAENSTDSTAWKEAVQDIGLKVGVRRHNVDPAAFWRELVPQATANAELGAKFRAHLAKKHADQLESLDEILVFVKRLPPASDPAERPDNHAPQLPFHQRSWPSEKLLRLHKR